MPDPVAINVEVRYAECDMQGHVFNGHYLTWFDMAHTAALGAALERSYRELVADGIDFVVAESGVRYLAAAHFEDQLSVEVRFEPPTTSSLTSRFTVTRDDGAGPEPTTVATGFLRHVCVDATAMTKRPWPDDVRAGLAGYAAR